jgi:hypothetical protein
MAGTFVVDGKALRFRPRFPFTAGTTYAFLTRAADDPASPTSRPLLLTRPVATRQASTVVAHIYPTADRLPVNTLRFYLRFSAPMSEGLADTAIELLDLRSGQVLPGAILPMQPELWDPRRTRLTLLLDPGRIKRGLMPHTEAGYPLTPGRAVALIVHRAFLDASGAPLAAGAERRYTIGPAIRQRLEPRHWRIEAVHAGTRLPVRAIFDRPIDHALGLRCLTVTDDAGKPVPGHSALEAGEWSWTFTPASTWSPSAYTLTVAPELEDVAGNSVTRVFDRDITNPDHRPRPAEPTQLSLAGRPNDSRLYLSPSTEKGMYIAEGERDEGQGRSVARDGGEERGIGD